MRRIYSPAGAYDMNILSSITNERVENFYQDRHAQVQSIVDMDYTTGNYTQAEKDTILKLDAKVSDPITYDYSDGWKTLLTRDFPTVFLLIALVVCIIISPVSLMNIRQAQTQSFFLPSMADGKPFGQS